MCGDARVEQDQDRDDHHEVHHRVTAAHERQHASVVRVMSDRRERARP